MNVFVLTGLAVLLMMLAGEKWRLGRRRHALNRTLHEIRRPLQALVLLSPPGEGPVPVGMRPVAEPVLQVMSAVTDLDRQLNGGPPPMGRSETVAARLMADACVRRWRSRASLSHKTIELHWAGPDGLLSGDGVALAAALENLIVNAIEHGGPRITVTGRLVGKRIRIEVLDDGISAAAGGNPGRVPEIVAASQGKGGHGHGLEVARRTAAAHGGKLETVFAADGSRAALVLPRSSRPAGSSSPVRVNW